MDETPPIYVTADDGSIAAGRDVILQYVVRACPRCEIRLVNPGQSICNHCDRQLRMERAKLQLTWMILAIIICFSVGWWLADVVGYSPRWIMAAGLTPVLYMSGCWCYVAVKVWAECDAERQLRAIWRWITSLR